MKLGNLAHQVTAPSNYPRAMITFAPDLWDMLDEYRKRREQSGLVRLGVRVALGLVDGGLRLESAADHLMVSCQSDSDVLDLARRCEDLADVLRDRLENE